MRGSRASASPAYERVPPHNVEAEESVLGAMMLSPGAIGAVSEILDAKDFYRESHAKIATSIRYPEKFILIAIFVYARALGTDELTGGAE